MLVRRNVEQEICPTGLAPPGQAQQIGIRLRNIPFLIEPRVADVVADLAWTLKSRFIALDVTDHPFSFRQVGEELRDIVVCDPTRPRDRRSAVLVSEIRIGPVLTQKLNDSPIAAVARHGTG